MLPAHHISSETGKGSSTVEQCLDISDKDKPQENSVRRSSSASVPDNQTYLKVETRCWSFVALAYILFENSWDGLSDNLDSIVDVIKSGLTDEDEEVVKHAANCTANLCSTQSLPTTNRSKDQYFHIHRSKDRFVRHNRKPC